jgi:hypothetical protein
MGTPILGFVLQPFCAVLRRRSRTRQSLEIAAITTSNRILAVAILQTLPAELARRKP